MTAAPALSAPAAPPRPSVEESYATLGAALWLAARAPAGDEIALAEAEARFREPILRGLFKLYRQQGRPLAFATWARLDPALARTLAERRRRPKLAEWDSGPEVHVVDVIAPFDDAPFVFDDLGRTLFGGRKARFLFPPNPLIAPIAPPPAPSGATADDGAAIEARIAEAAASGRPVSIVRLASDTAEPMTEGVIHLLRALMSGPGYGSEEADLQRMRSNLRAGLRRLTGYAGVAHVDGVPVGLFFGEIAGKPFNAGRMGREIAFFVHAAFRGRGIGGRLIAAFVDWGRAEGADWVNFLHSSGLAPEAAERAYEKAGAVRLGALFRLALTEGGKP